LDFGLPTKSNPPEGSGRSCRTQSKIQNPKSKMKTCWICWGRVGGQVRWCRWRSRRERPAITCWRTIRQYGRGEAAGGGRGGGLGAGRHRGLVSGRWRKRAEPELRGPAASRRGSPRLEAEHENLRAALAGCTQRGEGEAGLRLAGRLVVVLGRLGGYLTEGRERPGGRWLTLPGTEARTAQPGKSPECRRTAGHPPGRVRGSPGAVGGRALAIFRELDDRRGVAASLLGPWGRWPALRVDREAAQGAPGGEHGDLSPSGRSARHRRLTEQPGLPGPSSGRLRDRGGRSWSRAWPSGARTGDQWSIAESLSLLGLVANLQGNCEAAQALSEEKPGDLPSTSVNRGGLPPSVCTSWA